MGIVSLILGILATVFGIFCLVPGISYYGYRHRSRCCRYRPCSAGQQEGKEGHQHRRSGSFYHRHGSVCDPVHRLRRLPYRIGFHLILT